jgi:hypothetical protein
MSQVRHPGSASDSFPRGGLVLGGCIVTGDDPQWQCRKCKTKYGARRSAVE